MNEIEAVIREHAVRYPGMQPQDAVKLLYQNEFGAGHFVADEDKSRERIAAEYDVNGHDKDIPLFEKIGNGYVRCHLNSKYMKEEEISCLNKIFLLSAQRMMGERDSFRAKLYLLWQLSGEGIFRFGQQEMGRYLEQYEKDGFIMVSHSNDYKRAYAPAYRVVEERLCRLFPLLSETERLQKDRKRVAVAFDGRCAAGKTSAARDVAKMFRGEVIHMDDFFLPPELRTQERYEEAGGNIHYERFREEVIGGLLSGRDFRYRIFSCKKMDYDGDRAIRADGIVIVEGAYSMHPSFGSPYDLAVFFDVDRKEQERRIIGRDGKECFRNFKQRWIPLEEKYINNCHICEKCRIIVK